MTAPCLLGTTICAQDYTCDSIGKLHFKGGESDHGFCREVEPLHVYDGTGDVLGCIRDNPPFRDKVGELSRAGGGDSTYLQYDARCAGWKTTAATTSRGPSFSTLSALTHLTSHRQISTSATHQPT